MIRHDCTRQNTLNLLKLSIDITVRPDPYEGVWAWNALELLFEVFGIASGLDMSLASLFHPYQDQTRVLQYELICIFKTNFETHDSLALALLLRKTT